METRLLEVLFWEVTPRLIEDFLDEGVIFTSPQPSSSFRVKKAYSNFLESGPTFQFKETPAATVSETS